MGKQKEKESNGNTGNSIIILGKCFSCHKSYIFKLMVPFELVEPHEDGIRHAKRYLCPECGERLKQFNWVKEIEMEEKKEVKNANRNL